MGLSATNLAVAAIDLPIANTQEARHLLVMQHAAVEPQGLAADDPVAAIQEVELNQRLASVRSTVTGLPDQTVTESAIQPPSNSIQKE
jgi:hypothetical protein